MKLLFKFLFLTLPIVGFSQVLKPLSPINNQEQCGSDLIHKKMMESDPVYREKTIRLDKLIKESKNKSKNKKKALPLYRIPVVVHIMHKGEAIGVNTNITDEAVKRGILALNQKFRAQSGDWGTKTGAANTDMDIEFALAVQDASGNCTDGIVRYDMTGQAAYMSDGVDRTSGFGISDAALKSLSRWDPTKYYNIYLVWEIDNNECGSGTQGYAYFSGAHGGALDGMLQLACSFGDPGDGTFAHEIGHAFNLYHTFEGDVGGTICPPADSTLGDQCADTPPHIRSASNCNTGGINACTGTSTDLHVHNFMDYSSDACVSEFTADQVARARAAMVTHRSSYTTSTGLTPPAAPVADFTSSSTGVCAGSTINFFDNSSCVPNTFLNINWSGITHSWTFENQSGLIITSNEQNPIITFATPGIYSVSMTVNTGMGSDTKINAGYITITAGAPTIACIPTSTNNNANFGYTVSNVTFSGINNTTSSSINQAYTDFSCTKIATVDSAGTYNLSLTLNVNATNNENADVYIDYNNNGVFANSEKVMSVMLPMGSASQTFTQAITIRDSALINTPLRMRVVGEANIISGPCDNNFVGDVEDYTIFVNVPCSNPDIPTLSVTSDTIQSGSSDTLFVSAGNLNNAGSWKWYTASCGGNFVGTGDSLVVSPTTTTTYYARGEGGCAVLGDCDSITIIVTALPGSLLEFNTVGVTITENFNNFNGSGITPTGLNGRLNSTNWAITGLSDGNSTFLDSITTLDFARGIAGNGVTTGGIYAFTQTANPFMGVQVTGTDFTPGEFILRVQNNTGKIVDTITLGYDFVVYNDQNRSSSFYPSYSTDGISYTSLSAINDTTVGLMDGAPAFVSSSKSIKFGGLNIANASYIYIKWSSDYLPGAGSGDQFGIDNLTLKPDTALDCPTVILLLPDTISCTNTTVSVDGSGSPIGPNLSYLWTTPNGNITANAGTSIATVNSAGTYILTITNTASTCAKSDTLTVIADTLRPIAAITGADTVSCLVTSNTLDASSSTGASSYLWSTSNGTISGAVNGLTAIADSAGVYQVLITAANGCKDSITATVIGNFTLPVNIIATPDSITCSVLTVGIDAGTSVNADIYQWTALSGNITSATNIDSITVNAVGQYKLETTNSISGCLDTDTVTIVADNTAPSSVIVFPDTIKCTAPTVILDGSGSTSGATITYTWTTVGGNITAGAGTDSITVDAAGTYQLKVTNTASGCSDSTTVIVIADNTAPSASIASPDSLTCNNATVTLNGVSSTNYTSLVWTTAIGTIVGSTTNPTAVVSAIGTYQLKAVNSGSGCSDSTTVAVNQNTVLPTVSIASTDTIKCTTPTVGLNGTGSSQGINYNYLWTGGTIASGSTTDSATTSTAGTYQLKVTQTITGCTDSLSVTVAADNTTPSSVIVFPDTIKCTAPTVILDGSGSTSGATITYTWTTVGGNITAGAGTDSITVDAAGTYQLKVTNTASGCSDSTTVIVIADNTAPSASIASPDSLTCNNATVTLNGTTSTNYTSLVWTTATGTIVGSTTNPTAVASTVGTYQLKAVNSGSGCSDSTTVVIVSNTTAPVNTIVKDRDTLTCANPTIGISAKLTTGANTYQWTALGGGNIISATNIDSINVNAVGQYKLESSNSVTGCMDVDTVAVFADGSSVSVSVLMPDTITCTANSVVLDGSLSTSGGTITYLWSGGVIDAGQGSNTATVSNSGTYQLKVTNTANGCSDSLSTTVIVNTTSPIASVINSDTLSCLNQSIVLDGNASLNGDSYLWTGGTITAGANTSIATITTAGNYKLVVSNTSSGCKDSVNVTANYKNTMPTASFTEVKTNLLVNFTDASSGNGISLRSWDFGDGNTSNLTNPSNTYLAAGTYAVRLIVTDSCGVDTLTKNITVSLCATTFATVNNTICNGASYTFPDATTLTPTANMLGVLDTLINAAGCDSIVTTNLTVKDTSFSNQNITACVSATINGVVYTTSQIVTDVLVNSQGCDSVVTTNLTIKNPTSSNQNITACISATINGTVYTTSQIVTDVLVNSQGCDSVVTTNLTIKSPSSSTQNVTACTNATINGTVYTTSQVITDVLVNAQGCDSVVTTNLIIKNPSSSNQNITACISATINGVVYTTSQIVTDVLVNSQGCDSVVTTNLTIKNPSSSNQNITACVNATINGVVYTTSQIVTDVLVNSQGCDSVVTTNLTINKKAIASFTQTTTDLTASFVNTSANQTSVSWSFGDGKISIQNNPTNIYGANGTYTVCLKAINGCGTDSICKTITVKFNNPPIALDVSRNTDQNKALTINLTSQVSDLDNDPLTITADNPKNGTITIVGKTITYNPTNNFNGADSIIYVVCDNKAKCDTAIIRINVLAPCFTGDILGSVKVDSSFATTGEVELYTSGGKKLKTATLVNGSYSFQNVLIGGYRLLATGTLNGNNLITEYYKDAQTWEKSKVVDVFCRSQIQANFELEQQVILSGTTSISGTVKNNTTPVAGVSVSIALSTSPNSILASTKTDANGMFVFDNLPEKSFIVTADVVGNTSNSQAITTSSGTSVLEYCMNAGSLNNCKGVGVEELDKIIQNISVTPNPFINNVNIQFTLTEATEISIVIYSEIGVQLYEITNKNYLIGDHFIELANLNLASGVYYLKLQTENGEYTTKIISVK